MKTKEIARALNLNLEEYLRVEPNIASILGLKISNSGEYLYTDEHLQVLRDVFLQEEPLVEKEPLQTKTPDSIPIKQDSHARVFGSRPKLSQEPQPFQFAEFEPKENDTKSGPKKIIPATDFFEKIQKNEPETNKKTVDFEPLLEMMKQQKTELEQRILTLENQDIEAMRREILQLKKENHTWKKEVATLKNIIKNQNEEKKILIEKLNQRFSLKGLFQWKTSNFRLWLDAGEHSA